MKMLLDTHALLWAFSAPEKFKKSASLLRDRASTVFVSSATAWEISTKHRLGKLPEAKLLLAGYGDHLARLLATDLPVRYEHAVLAGAFTQTHRDPFDRILAAQAVVEELVLITNDPAFSDFPVATLW